MTQTMQKNDKLTHLFDIELLYSEEATKSRDDADRVGDYIGSGRGSVRGPDLRGEVTHWDLFEDVQETVCRSNLSGKIRTDEGAQIEFDSMGFFTRPDSSQPNRWITTAAVHLHSEDESYAWLNSRLALWEGTFDMDAYRHHYQVYVHNNKNN